MSLWLAVSFALAFSFTNGFHDAANAIATLVATRGATPGQAVVLSGVFKMLGAVVVGTAVADTIAGIVTVSGPDAAAAIGSGALAAVVWNLLTWWRALPSSSAHALVGGLVGSALAASGTVKWGGLDGWRPTGVLGILIALALSPCIGFFAGAILIRLARRLLRRASRQVGAPIKLGEWAMSAALSFGQGANDAQKAMGVIAALLLAAGRIETLTVPLWAQIGCGAALTLGTLMGGWRIVYTVGRGIVRLAPLDSFASQTAATMVILPASYAGAPVSTTHVVASSVVGVGTERRGFRHVRWAVVRAMAFAWVLTLPVCGVLGAVSFVIWRGLG
jgi:PiT family inorganic phosphate transporter